MNLPTKPTNWVKNFVREERNTGVARLRFKKGGYVDQDEQEVALGTELLFNMPALRDGFIRFNGAGKAPHKAMCLVASGKRIKRNDLSDPNPNMWPLKNGEPDDPWIKLYEIDAADSQTGDQYVLATMTLTSRNAVLDLLVNWEATQAQHPNKLPVVALGTALVDVGEFKDIPAPLFSITGWIENTGVVGSREPGPDPEPDPEPDDGGGGIPADMDDDIPW